MIYGVGTDIIEMDRVKKACEKEAFLRKIFTSAERDMILMDLKKAAGNFAVKEAVVKMFGTGFRKVTPKDIEVLRDEAGKPYVNLYHAAKEIADANHIVIHVSISNTKDYATAFVVGEVSV